MSGMSVAIFHKDLSQPSGSYYSHIALGVGAMQTAKVLRRHGIRARVFAVKTPEQIAQILSTHGPVKFAVLEAPWIKTKAIEELISQFPCTEFLLRCHSQVAFLQVDHNAVRLVREALRLQESSTNFRVCGNSKRLCDFLRVAYGSECLLLPNLYDVHREKRRHRPLPHVGPVKIGSFGASRILKFHSTAAAAALMVARNRGTDLSFYLNIGRDDPGEWILNAIRQMFADVPWAKLVEVPWAPWPEFRHQVAAMDVCLQLSATESFNIVTADAVAEGVPSVVGPAIDWAPSYWQAPIDDPAAVARTAEILLDDRYAPEDGLKALTEYDDMSVAAWKKTLATALEDRAAA
jgi:hypothetical protein